MRWKLVKGQLALTSHQVWLQPKSHRTAIRFYLTYKRMLVKHRSYLLLGGAVISTLLFLLLTYRMSQDRRESRSVSFDMSQQSNQSNGLHGKVRKSMARLTFPASIAPSNIRKQRNALSRMQNELKRQLGQAECNMAKLKKQRNVASSGGWCEEDSDPKKSKSHAFDRRLASSLGHFLSGQRVASFGDGPGKYKKYLLKQGLVASYDAYDGAPFCEKVTSGAVKFLDLTLPQYGLPVYDWVICLEVAEHVPARYERVLVNNLARHARKGIVLSWGHPGQEGFHHVNNKRSDDVKRLLDEAGFRLYDSDSMSLRRNSTFTWFQENIFVFRRKPDVVLKDDDA